MAKNPPIKPVTRPDYRGYEAAKRKLPPMEPKNYQRHIRALAKLYGI